MAIQPLPIVPATIIILPPGNFIVAASITPVVLVPTNSMRRMVTIYNDSTAVLYVALNTIVSSTNYTVQLFPQDYFELPIPIYTGDIWGVWAAVNGRANSMEFY